MARFIHAQASDEFGSSNVGLFLNDILQQNLDSSESISLEPRFKSGHLQKQITSFKNALQFAPCWPP